MELETAHISQFQKLVPEAWAWLLSLPPSLALLLHLLHAKRYNCKHNANVMITVAQSWPYSTNSGFLCASLKGGQGHRMFAKGSDTEEGV